MRSRWLPSSLSAGPQKSPWWTKSIPAPASAALLNISRLASTEKAIFPSSEPSLSTCRPFKEESMFKNPSRSRRPRIYESSLRVVNAMFTELYTNNRGKSTGFGDIISKLNTPWRGSLGRQTHLEFSAADRAKTISNTRFSHQGSLIFLLNYSEVDPMALFLLFSTPISPLLFT